MKKYGFKGWLYLLPAILNSASQSFFGVGAYNYAYVLRDEYFLQALKNTFLLVIITVPLSTGLALLISVALGSIKKLRELFQTIYFLPYVTNTLAVGLVFMILFKKTAYTDGLVNLVINFFGSPSVDFIEGPYWAKMFVLCFYTVWVVMPFKILILTSALASVRQDFYNAARLDDTPKWNAAGMNTIVGYVYDMLYGNGGGWPSYASAAAIILFAIVLTITCINLLVSRKHVYYV